MSPSPQILDTWLADVRRHLGPLSRSESEEVIAELRSHLIDRTQGSTDTSEMGAALKAMGDPRELARLNIAARLAARPGAAPWRILARIGTLARVSLGGFWAFLVSLTGYALAASWLLVAVVKPFLPSDVGLWRRGGETFSLTLGLMNHRPAGAELMGWWIVPVGLLVGPLLAFATWRYGRWSLRRLALAATPVTA